LAYGVSSDLKSFKLTDKDGKLVHGTFFERYNALLEALLGDDANTNVFKSNPVSETFFFDCEEKSLSGLRKQYVSTKEGRPGLIFTYEASYSGDYYFYIPFSTSKPLKVGFERSNIMEDTAVYANVEFFGDNSDHILHAGHYEKGDKILITVDMPLESTVTFREDIPSLWCLDTDNYDACMKKLGYGPQFNIAPDSVDDHLTGTISTLSDSQMILTTIPYDEGWNVYLNGEKVKTYEALGALMAFDVSTAGEYTLELEYFPECYRLGFILSGFGIGAFLLLCAAEFVLKRTLLKNRIPVYQRDLWVLGDFDTEEADPCIAPELSATDDISTDEVPSSEESTPEADSDITEANDNND
jgi:hypothetical protein